MIVSRNICNFRRYELKFSHPGTFHRNFYLSPINSLISICNSNSANFKRRRTRFSICVVKLEIQTRKYQLLSGRYLIKSQNYFSIYFRVFQSNCQIICRSSNIG